jgi:ribonuclease HII
MLQIFYKQQQIEAGCDEAGRGCYAGPVFAAAVILPPHFSHPLLNDSKQVTPANRKLLRSFIEEHALAWAVASVTVAEIDQTNILKASFKAMHLAVDALQTKPQFLLIDGNRFTPYPGIDHTCIVKGDGKFAAIAAASILAKTHRDAYMEQLDAEFPQYGWKQNKGYGSAAHRAAIASFGLCRHHRHSFNILPQQARLFT